MNQYNFIAEDKLDEENSFNFTVFADDYNTALDRAVRMLDINLYRVKEV